MYLKGLLGNKYIYILILEIIRMDKDVNYNKIPQVFFYVLSMPSDDSSPILEDTLGYAEYRR